MEWMFEFNPKNRPTAEQVLKHNFFANKMEPAEMQKAIDIINGKKEKNNSPLKADNVIESLKVGPNGIKIKK